MAESVKRKALIYCRISQDRVGAGLGVKRQEEDCRALAKRLGWRVIGVYVDNDTSAYSGKPRRNYNRMMADLRSRRGNAVLVWHTDRLHRSPAELEDYITVCERHGVTTHTVQAGTLDLSTPSGRMVARQLGVAARYESEHKSVRTRRAQEQAVLAGRWTGGAPPFGWRIIAPDKAKIEPKEAQVIRKATRALLSGESIYKLINDLNERGITTSVGKPWSHISLRQVVMRARNAGLATWQGEVVGKSVFPKIVEEHEWRAVCAKLKDPNRRTTRDNRPRWLLTNLICCECPGCGRVMKAGTTTVGRNNPTRVPKYRCYDTGAGHVVISALLVNEVVRDTMIARLKRSDIRDLLIPPPDTEDARDLAAEEAALTAELQTLAEACGRREITALQLAEASRGIQERLEEIEAAKPANDRESLLREIVESPDVAATWDSYSLQRRRSIIAELARFWVAPVGRGGRYSDESVQVDWLD